MRKTVKVGIVLLIVGVIMLIFGIANNGIQSVYWDNGFRVVHTQDKTYYPDKITDITLTNTSNVTVRRGTTASIHVTTTSQLPTVTTKAGHVKITAKAATAGHVGYMFNGDKPATTTVITVPAGTTINWLKAGTDGHQELAGTLTLTNLTVNHLQLLTDNMTARLTNVNIKKDNLLATNKLALTNVTAPALQAEANTVTITQSRFNQGTSKVTGDDGDYRISQSRFKKLKLRNHDGDIHLDRNRVTTLTATTDDGDIHLTANKNVGVYAKTDDGDLNIFNHHRDDGASYRYQPNASQQYHLTTVDGDITAIAAA